jgi:hypothetical protein
VKPGIHTITEESYHADPGERPSLSASIASILCSQSPKHAWAAHPRLNPRFERKAEEKFDVGNVCHSILLDGRDLEDVVFVVHENDWRKKDAKEAREYGRSIGKVPLLAYQREDVGAMVAAVKEQIAELDVQPTLLTEGKAEQTLVWDEDGVTCRARLDWLRDDLAACDDLKTTSRSANPLAYSRALYAVGGDVQAAFYLRGIEALTGARPAFRWIVVETSPPYVLTPIAPGLDVLALGEAKVERALKLWRRCLENDKWPGYTTELAYAEMPAYEESRFLEREEIAA